MSVYGPCISLILMLPYKSGTILYFMDQIKLLIQYHMIASKTVKPYPDLNDFQIYAHFMIQGLTTLLNAEKVPQNSAPEF